MHFGQNAENQTLNIEDLSLIKQKTLFPSDTEDLRPKKKLYLGRYGLFGE